MVKPRRNFSRAPPRSPSVPRRGASTASRKLADPFVMPSQNVLSVADTSELQYCLKNTGKNTTMTVVANAELPQS